MDIVSRVKYISYGLKTVWHIYHVYKILKEHVAYASSKSLNIKESINNSSAFLQIKFPVCSGEVVHLCYIYSN